MKIFAVTPRSTDAVEDVLMSKEEAEVKYQAS